MKKLPKNRIPASPFNFSIFRHSQFGFAPIIAVIASGFFLAVAIFLVTTQSFRLPGTITPNPSPASFDEIEISAPIPVDPSDEACDDEFNFDCDDLEGDDVDPADLAGPD